MFWHIVVLRHLFGIWSENCRKLVSINLRINRNIEELSINLLLSNYFSPHLGEIFSLALFQIIWLNWWLSFQHFLGGGQDFLLFSIWLTFITLMIGLIVLQSIWHADQQIQIKTLFIHGKLWWHLCMLRLMLKIINVLACPAIYRNQNKIQDFS